MDKINSINTNALLKINNINTLSLDELCNILCSGPIRIEEHHNGYIIYNIDFVIDICYRHKYNNYTRNRSGLSRINVLKYKGIREEDYYYHNTDNPAYLEFNRLGKISDIIYFINNKKHRVNKPAYISYGNNGMAILECYYLNNLRHNIIGPATRGFGNSSFGNNRYYNRYFIFDAEYSLQEFLNFRKARKELKLGG